MVNAFLIRGDRRTFFGQAYRVLKPGAFFALTEHGLGAKGAPHYPLPWSMDGSGAYLVTAAETLLESAGFVDIRRGKIPARNT